MLQVTKTQLSGLGRKGNFLAWIIEKSNLCCRLNWIDLRESCAFANAVSLSGMRTPPHPSPSSQFQFIPESHCKCHLLCKAILSHVLSKVSLVFSHRNSQSTLSLLLVMWSHGRHPLNACWWVPGVREGASLGQQELYFSSKTGEKGGNLDSVSRTYRLSKGFKNIWDQKTNL